MYRRILVPVDGSQASLKSKRIRLLWVTSNCGSMVSAFAPR